MGATSPAARLTARIPPVMIPGKACGKTILRMVSNLVTPSARLASLMPWGMAFNDSSVATMTAGRVITAGVSEAQIMAGLPHKGSGLPVVIVATEESLKAIPQGMREASLALG